jgi:hypothetical protein
MKKILNYLFILMLFKIISCTNCHNKYTDYCSVDYYKKFLSNQKIEELEFEIINRLNDSGFQGAFKINGDSILFGWHEGELNNINSISIARVLRKNKFYATYHRINEWTYFKKYPGFIDESCGLLFVSYGSEIPNEIKVFELLVDNGLNGKWYFVEAKI